MHGGEGEGRKRGSRHMWTSPTRGNSSLVLAAAAASSSSPPPHVSPSSSPNSFFKDGRKISIGDCALFKPPQDSPPFIGIIRWLTTGKENKFKLGVNWLYRPAEVKLGKGILLEAAPNEIFYSFHKDEIPAASLLHLCKVAFLPKGVELPSGICSFVCRRVYDIKSRCLWWLTDKDYINERQEEVDQLLYKTRIEMHATVQSGGRSPKTMNGPTSTSQLKPGSDGGQSAASFSSQVKGKKRERGDQVSEPVKRERSTKMDDVESGFNRSESSWKSEIAKFTEKGGLVDFEGVEKLVQLMLPERNERKIDLVGRSMLAGVVAATDKFDCLNGFVLRGLPVFDEWLQEVHKGKIGDGSGSKDSDKPVEEFLLVLLRALDKLPVNLHALQMCNIGKSVNHLRTHKNLEIQKKARSLVDTWKKRVEAEIDAKAGSNQAVSWPAARSRLTEVSHGGNRHSSVSSEVATKSSVVQLSASKAAPVKLIQGETLLKTASASPGSTKSAMSPVSMGNNIKEGQARNAGAVGVSDIPVTSTKDEKSSSSSQSHNNSQSCSSDQAKTGVLSGKEDARSSTAISMNATKAIGVSSRHRKSVNGFPGPTLSGVQRESGTGRSSSLHRNPAPEKASQSSLLSDKTTDVPVAEGNNQKLIVKIPNRGRSPAQSASGGSLEDSSIMNSRASSPALSEKHDQSDRYLKEKHYTDRGNITDVNNESWQSDDLREVLNGSDDGDGSPATLPDEENLTGDDARKLAEVSKAPLSSFDNEHKSKKLHDASFGSINALIESCAKYSETNTPISAGDDIGMNLLASVAAGEISKSGVNSPTVSPKRNTPIVEHSCTAIVSRVKSPAGDDFSQNQSQPVVDERHEKNPSTVGMQQTVERCLPGDVKIEEAPAAGPGPGPGSIADKTPNCGNKEQLDASCTGKDAKVVEGSLSYSCSETDGKDMRKVKEDSGITGQPDQNPLSLHPEFAKRTEAELLHPIVSARDKVPDNAEEVKVEKSDETDGRSQSTEKQKTKDSKSESATNLKGECVEETRKVNEISGQHVAVSHTASPAQKQEPVKQINSRGSKLTVTEADETEECTSAAADTSLSAAKGSDVETRVEFDLNEGFDADDGKCGEQNNLKASGSSSVQLISPLPVPVSSVSTSLPPSITVAAAAKRPFVPPEDLLKNRGEIRWKGSAATSAFRPAEPRKVLEGPVYEAATGKPSRTPLDIDLNVPDERILEDLVSRTPTQAASCITDLKNNSEVVHDKLISPVNVRSSGGLDLDLNRMDDPAEIGDHLMSNGHRMDVQPVKLVSGGLRNGEMSTRRDFDLNDGPHIDEVSAEPSSFVLNSKNSAPSQLSALGPRIKNSEIGSLSSWFTQGNPYQNIPIQSILPDRGDQSFPMVAPAGPQRMLTPPSGSTPFNPDVYRGAVLSSSPAVPFPSTPYQYPVFPFGTNFPITSATFSGGPTTYVDSASGGRLCFPAVHSQVLAPAGALPSHFARPGSFVVGLPDSNSNVGAESCGKWGRQGLDLNAGPIGPDTEGRDEASSLASRQLSVAGSQALAEQSRMYQVAGGGVLKRKEPEGGWEGYKQSSWQ